jgi:hypothetical protein
METLFEVAAALREGLQDYKAESDGMEWDIIIIIIHHYHQQTISIPLFFWFSFLGEWRWLGWGHWMYLQNSSMKFINAKKVGKSYFSFPSFSPFTFRWTWKLHWNFCTPPRPKCHVCFSDA